MSSKVALQRMHRLIKVCSSISGWTLTLFIAASLSAQTLSSINGTVTDSSGAVVGTAKVTVTNDATHVAKTAETSSAGTYTITDLIPGTYTVTVDLSGFQSSEHKGVNVDVGRSSTVDAILQPGNTQQTVTVSESAITLDTSAPSLNTTIENKVVQELPTQVSGGRGRQIDNFIFLAPGVTGDTFSHRINGGVDFQNEVVFNGIPMAQSETQGFQTIWNPPYELVNSFNVLRSSFSAQYGLAQGVVTYQTASGTNQYHGDAFEIIRNNFFDAKGAYNPTVPVDKENNYGFTIAGPVTIPKLYNGKNRTFFHLSMEWYRENKTETTFFSLPTAAEKAGDFSALVDSSGKQVPIFNPAAGQPGSCTAAGNTPGMQFRGNVIPATCFGTTSAGLLQYWPNPSLPGFSNNSQSLQGVVPTRQNPWGFTVDHNITDRQSAHFAVWRDKQTSYGDNTGTHLQLSNPLADQTYYPDLGTVFIVNYSFTINPHLVMTAGASWLGELNFQIPQRTGPQPVPSAAPGAPQVPGINFDGPLSPSNTGSSNTNSINRKLGTVAENNFLWIKGKHTFNIGWEYRRTYQDDNECQQCAGNFNFSNNQTADPNNLSNTGNSFASFLLGTVDSANRTGSQELRLRNLDISSYIQDDIKWTPRLTVNIGVRWDVMTPFTEVNNNIVYFDSTIPNPGAGGRLGAANKFGYCIGCASSDRAFVHWNHFSPRVGFSYELNKKTVLQSGFSVNYLNGGAYEYGISKVAVNYGNLLLGTFTRPSTGSTNPGFGSWDAAGNILPEPGPKPFTPALGVGSSINGFDLENDGVAPYDAVWNIGIQRELPSNMFLTVNYTGNRANHLPAQLNPINQLPSGFVAQYGSKLGDPYATTGVQLGIPLPYPTFLTDFPSANVLQALRPYPQYSDIFDNFDMTGSSLYHALQVSAEKRYSSGLSFLVSYNLSKMMSNTNSGFTSFASRALNKDNQKAEWSIDNNDETNMVSIAATYELPFGKGRPFLNHGGVVNAVLGGWQISPLLTYSTGTPLFSNGGPVYVSGDPTGNNCAPCNRANVVSGVPQMFSYSNVYKGLPVINAAAFSDPGPWVIGNSQRVLGGLRNPFHYNENVALAKYFAIGEHVKLKLEIEYFNVLNRVVFGGPNENFNDANFGKVINNQANTQRQGQGHLAITF